MYEKLSMTKFYENEKLWVSPVDSDKIQYIVVTTLTVPV